MSATRSTAHFPIVDLALGIITDADKAKAVQALYAYFEELGVDGVTALVAADNAYRHPHNWRPLDDLYVQARKKLMDNITWAHGPSKMRFTFNIYRNGLRGYDVTGKAVVDFGCGEIHPYNISALFFLNGAARCWAIDTASTINVAAAARSLYELLIDALSEPSRWLLPGADESLFAIRIGQFDIAALNRGDLAVGVARVPIVHHIGLIETFLDQPESVDVMVSSTVIEHVHNLLELSRHFHRIMTPTGVSYHNVDYSDHSVHADPTKNYWSFMTVGNELPDGGDINKLRNSETEAIFRAAGFTLVMDPLFRLKPPEEVLRTLLPKYQSLSVDDVEIVSSGLLLTK